MQRACNVAIHGGLLVLLTCSPLAFGAVYTWGIAFVEFTTLFMALAWALKLLHAGTLRLVRTPLNLPMLLFLGLVGWQLLPLPPAVLRLMSSNTYALYQRTLIGWPDHDALPLLPQDVTAGQPTGGQGREAEGGRGWRPLSLYPHQTRAALVLAFTYAAVLLIVVNTVRTRVQLKRLLLTIVAVGGVVAVIGLIQKVSGTAKVYGVWQPQFEGSPFGPYVNRNHFAGYVAMVLPLGLGWLYGELSRGYRGVGGQGWRQRLASLVSGRNGRLLLLGCALVNMAAALLFSASRGGIVSFAVSILFLSVLIYLPRGEGRRVGIVIPVVLAGVVVYALWLGLDHVVERFFQPEEGRTLIWSGTLRLITDYPWLGTGLGTYVSSFRRHKPVLDPGLVDHAHNDYLELLAEAGALGFLIVVGGLGWFCWRTLQRWYTRHDPEVRGIVLGGLASVLAMGIHSLVDFNLHIPANAVLLAVILGLTAVAVHLRRRHGRSVVVFRTRQLDVPRLLRLALFPLALLAAVTLTLPVAYSVAAERHAQLGDSLERGIGGDLELDSVVEQWAHAVALDPGKADYHYRLGQVYDRAMRAYWSSNPSRALTYGIRAIAAYRQALLRNPTSPFPYLAWGWSLENVSRLAPWAAGQRVRTATSIQVGGNDLGWLLAQLMQHPERAAQWSRQLLQTATHLAPTAAFAHYSAGLYALERWEALPLEERARAIQELRSAVQLEPSYAPSVLQALRERTGDMDLVRAMGRGIRGESRW